MYRDPLWYFNKDEATEKYLGEVKLATTAEAVAGTNDEKAVTPEGLQASIDDNVTAASTTVVGQVRLATVVETQAGTAVDIANTPAGLAAVAIAGAPNWSETVSGIGQIATSVEAVALTLDTVAMTPSKVADVLAAPAAIGSGTPAAGAFTTLSSSGLASLGASATVVTGAVALNLGADASTGAINVGTGAGARTVTVGNITGATAVAINSGTGHTTITSTGAGDIVLNGGDKITLDSAGTVDINSSAAAINIGDDDVDQAVNIATDGERTLTIGSANGAAGVVIQGGTGDVSISNNAIAHNLSLGNKTGATAVAMEVGTGHFTLDGVASSTYTVGASTTTGTVTIGGTAQTGTMTLGDSSGINIVQIGSGEGATTVNVAGGATAAKVVNVATGAVANLVTIGTVTGVATTTINAGSGSILHVGPASYTPDAITATSAGVAASVATVVTEITTNGDSDLDNVTLANGIDGQVKIFAVVAVGNVADSVKITPASMIGGTQITFAANPLGLGCQMVYDAGAAGWIVTGNNAGTVA